MVLNAVGPGTDQLGSFHRLYLFDVLFKTQQNYVGTNLGPQGMERSNFVDFVSRALQNEAVFQPGIWGRKTWLKY